MKNSRAVPYIIVAVIVVVAVAGYAWFLQAHAERVHAAAQPSTKAPLDWPPVPANLPAPSPAAGPAKVLYLVVGQTVRIDFNRNIPKGVLASTSQEEIEGRSVRLTPTAPGFGVLQLSDQKGQERWSVAYVAWQNASEFPNDAWLTPAGEGGYVIPVRVKDPAWNGLEARSADPIRWGESIP